jgi:hypothetical protein
MRIRYLYNTGVALAAGFLVVATQSFSAAVVAWLTFGIAAAITLAALGILAAPSGLVHRILGGLTLTLGVWTIVASLVFVPTTVLWLGFASALAFVGLALAGLTIHEFTTERVVHSFEVGQLDNRRHREPAAA